MKLLKHNRTGKVHILMVRNETRCAYHRWPSDIEFEGDLDNVTCKKCRANYEAQSRTITA